MKTFLVVTVMLILAPAAPGQDRDLEFAEMLGRDEYDDLAEYVLNHVLYSPVFTEQTLGRYRFVRIAMIRAERESQIDRKMILIDEAVAKINNYLKVSQDAGVEWRAKIDLIDLDAAKAVALATVAETVPTTGERNDYLRRSRDIYGKLAARLDKFLSDERSTAKKTPEEVKEMRGKFWGYLYEYASLTFKVGEYERVDRLLKQYGGLFPGVPFGGEPFGAKFEELMRRNEEAMNKSK